MAPNNTVGLLVGMPDAKGHTQPITGWTADARRIINELKHKHCFININRQMSNKKNLEQPEKYVAISRQKGVMARSRLDAVKVFQNQEQPSV